jgi:hypothetical protein
MSHPHIRRLFAQPAMFAVVTCTHTHNARIHSPDRRMTAAPPRQRCSLWRRRTWCCNTCPSSTCFRLIPYAFSTSPSCSRSLPSLPPSLPPFLRPSLPTPLSLAASESVLKAFVKRHSLSLHRRASTGSTHSSRMCLQAHKPPPQALQTLQTVLQASLPQIQVP